MTNPTPGIPNETVTPPEGNTKMNVIEKAMHDAITRVRQLESEVERMTKDRDSWVTASTHATDTCKRLKAERDAALTEVECLRGVVAAVEEIHRPIPKQFMLADCVSGNGCEHDECPAISVDVCEACWTFVDATGVDWHEKNAPPEIIYPCPTTNAIKLRTALTGATK